MHTSYAYPGHLVILLDVALVAAACLLAVLGPRLCGPALERADHWIRRLARHPARVVVAVGLFGVLGNALVFLVWGPPVPTVADEYSYLLAADTFASGRLSNPSHPMWRHFDTPHVLQWPSYASKYPPAQGLLLALGQVLGSPAWALCLSAGLLGAAMTWMFLAWLPAPWAVVGGCLALLRLGIGSYWNQTYWGGSVAAIGGALLYGALYRLTKRASRGQALILAAGLVLLAASRPYEGLLASLPAAVGMVRLVLRLGRPAWGRVVPPIAGVLALAALATGYYNQRVTGDPWQPPHAGYQNAYNHKSEWIFETWQGPVFEHQARAPDRTAATSQAPGPRPPWLGRAVRQGLHRASRMLYFALGLTMIVPLLAWAVLRARGRRAAGSPSSGALVAACVLVAAAGSLTREWFPHYAAPIAGPLLVLGLQGLRWLSSRRRNDRPVGRLLVAVVVGIHFVLFLVQLPAYRADDGDPGRQRARITARLSEGPERHLVLVQGSGHGGGNWTANAADIDAAPVVWARDLGAQANLALLDYFQERRVWRLDSIAYGERELTAYPR